MKTSQLKEQRGCFLKTETHGQTIKDYLVKMITSVLNRFNEINGNKMNEQNEARKNMFPGHWPCHFQIRASKFCIGFSIFRSTSNDYTLQIASINLL